MAKTATIQTRIEPEVKVAVEKILRELGLSMTEAIGLFLNRVRLEKGIPFEVKIPNAETLKTFRETDEGKNLSKSYSKFDDMWNDLNKND